MRILILGANLAGLLSALEMRRQGHEVCVLVHGAEGAHLPAPALVFTDPGPWSSPQGALSTLGALLKNQGDLRLDADGLGHLGWLMRSLSQRGGSRARSQALRVLAMARRSRLALDELQGSDYRLEAPQPITMLSVLTSTREAKQHVQRGPMWHLGTRPTSGPLSAEQAALPQLDAAWAQNSLVLKSEGLMLADGAAVRAGLCQHLVQLGVRFIYDQVISSVEHTGLHLHGVTLRGTLNHADDVDCDLVVAASVPASQPLLHSLGLKPDLAPMTRLSLQVTLPDASAEPLYIHDRPSGVRMIRQGSCLWVHGPMWLGEPEGPQTQEVADLNAVVARYFGHHASHVWSQPLMQTSWVTPDGLPLVSRTPTRNLLLNLGHHSAIAPLAFGATAVLRSLLDARPSQRQLVIPPSPWAQSAAPLATSTQGSRHD